MCSFISYSLVWLVSLSEKFLEIQLFFSVPLKHSRVFRGTWGALTSKSSWLQNLTHLLDSPAAFSSSDLIPLSGAELSTAILQCPPRRVLIYDLMHASYWKPMMSTLSQQHGGHRSCHPLNLSPKHHHWPLKSLCTSARPPHWAVAS